MEERRLAFRRTALALAATLPWAGCAQGIDNDQTVPIESPNDAQIAGVLRTANEGEVEQAKIALSRATNAEVLGFAERMVTDHEAADAHLAALVDERGIGFEESDTGTELEAQSSQIASDLAQTTGPNFDQLYMNGQVAMHSQVLALIDEVLEPSVTSDAMADELTVTRALFAEHLQAAEGIRAGL